MRFCCGSLGGERKRSPAPARRRPAVGIVGSERSASTTPGAAGDRSHGRRRITQRACHSRRGIGIGAIWLRHLGRLEEALSSLDQAEASGWERDDVLRERALILMELGNFQAAVDSFAEAFELDPKRAHAWYGHAAALRKLGRHREALRSIERALELHPSAAARWLRGELLAALDGSGGVP